MQAPKGIGIAALQPHLDPEFHPEPRGSAAARNFGPIAPPNRVRASSYTPFAASQPLSGRTSPTPLEAMGPPPRRRSSIEEAEIKRPAFVARTGLGGRTVFRGGGQRRATAVDPRLAPPIFTSSQMLGAAQQLTAAMEASATDERQKTGFAFKGSVALLAAGIKLEPGDVDVVTDNIPQAQRAVKAMGYTTQPTAFSSKVAAVPARGLPPLDVLSSQDWAEDLRGARMLSGVRVKSLAAMIKDLEIDPRPEKAERNKHALAFLRAQEEAASKPAAASSDAPAST